MGYVDLNSLHDPATGTSPPATYGDQIRDNDEYLYARGPFICTSGTRPGAPFIGQTIFETNTKKTLQWDGAAWWTIAIAGNDRTAFPGVVLTQGGVVACTVDLSEYRIINGVCEWWFKVAANSSPAGGGNPVTLSTPVTAAAGAARHTGAGIIFDSSAGTIDAGSWELASTTTIQILVGEGTNAGWGATPNISIATGDSMRGHVRFPVAVAA